MSRYSHWGPRDIQGNEAIEPRLSPVDLGGGHPRCDVLVARPRYSSVPVPGLSRDLVTGGKHKGFGGNRMVRLVACDRPQLQYQLRSDLLLVAKLSSSSITARLSPLRITGGSLDEHH